MPVGATIGAIGSVASAGIGAWGASNAASAQADAANNALAFQQRVYNENRQNFRPYLNTGAGATYSLASLYGLPGADGQVKPPDYSQFYNSPDYNFAYQQGQNATQNVLSAQGNLLSGSGLAALTNFGQGLASQQYGNYFNRLLSLANMGETAASNMAGTSTQAAGQIGNTMQGVGQANASGYVGMANAISGGVGGAANSLALPYMANYLKGTTSSYAPMSLSAGNYGGTGGGLGGFY